MFIDACLARNRVARLTMTPKTMTTIDFVVANERARELRIEDASVRSRRLIVMEIEHSHTYTRQTQTHILGDIAIAKREAHVRRTATTVHNTGTEQSYSFYLIFTDDVNVRLKLFAMKASNVAQPDVDAHRWASGRACNEQNACSIQFSLVIINVPIYYFI